MVPPWQRRGALQGGFRRQGTHDDDHLSQHRSWRRLGRGGNRPVVLQGVLGEVCVSAGDQYHLLCHDTLDRKLLHTDNCLLLTAPSPCPSLPPPTISSARLSNCS